MEYVKKGKLFICLWYTIPKMMGGLVLNRQVFTKSTVKESTSVRLARMAKNLGVGFISAVVAGIISGLLLRLIMKIIAIAFPHLASGFTFEGTSVLLLVGVGFSLVNSIIYTFSFHYLPKGWFRKGLVYGSIILMIYGIPFFLSNPGSELFGPQAPLVICLFSLLFILGGLLLALFVDRITNWANQTKARLKYIYFSFVILIIPAIVMSYLFIHDTVYKLIPAISSNF